MLKKKNFGITFVVVFLSAFMWLVFGPAEIFFSNATEFDFVYGDFFGLLALLTIVITATLTLVILLLPEKVCLAVVSLLFSVAITGYIQVMFLNQRLSLLGESAGGYRIQAGKAVGNLLVWILSFGIVIVLAYCKNDIWKKTVFFIALFLLAIQFVAYLSLLMTAKEEAYKRSEGFWMLSGEEQYHVSEDRNIIVFVLDCFSNQYIDSMNNRYPGATDFLHDFTYYDNADCTYYGTFPSLPHMLTGCEVAEGMTVNEWCKWIWDNEKTNSFYQDLKEKNYITNVYTADDQVLVCGNGRKILNGKIHNLVNSSSEVVVDHTLLVKTLMKMSGYRLAPYILKQYLYTDVAEYENIVRVKENPIYYNNYDFYQGLLEQRLSASKEHNYFVVEHLVGTHSYTTNEYGHYSKETTLEETAKGCMLIVEEYLNQLKELGVYENSTIIITSDHGVEDESQVIFFVKQQGESHAVMNISSAPIGHTDFLATIASAVGIETERYGIPIFDFYDGEQRQRTVWVRKYDENYPSVPCYTGERAGSANVYYGYSYTGGLPELLKRIEDGPSQIMMMQDSHY